MARAQGARALMALAFETTYGTPPAGGFTRMPFASTSLGAEQPLLNSELLGYGRDPLAPIKDAVMADGDVVVPVHFESYWPRAESCLLRETVFGTPQKPAYHNLCILVRLSAFRQLRRSPDQGDALVPVSPRLSLARPRLITQDSVVAQHPDDDGTFRQCLDLVSSAYLVGRAVFHHRRADLPKSIRTAHRACAEPKHRDQRGGGWRRPASGVGFHRFSPMLKAVQPTARRVPQRGGGSAGTERL